MPAAATAPVNPKSAGMIRLLVSNQRDGVGKPRRRSTGSSAERDIIRRSPDSVWQYVCEVRMECHGQIEEMTDELIRRGYRVTMQPKGNNPCQILWFARESPPLHTGQQANS